MTLRPRWVELWLVFYSFCLVLLPPLQIGSKYVFWAELALLPALVVFAWQAGRAQMPRPPKALVWVWLVLVMAFVSGMFRGDGAVKVAQYTLAGDLFSLSGDGVRFVRWVLILSTPWLLMPALGRLNFSLNFGQGSQNSRPPKDHPSASALNLFLTVLTFLTTVSAALTALDHFGILDLGKLYVHLDSGVWDHRAFGTFVTPLEASLMYASAGFWAALEGIRGFGDSKRPGRNDLSTKLRSGIWLSASLICLTALWWTKGFTGISALIASASFVLWRRPGTRPKFALLFLLAIALLFIFAFTDEAFRANKLVNLRSRTEAWVNWYHASLAHPWFFITGMGFTNVNTDSSPMWALFVGGFLLLISVVRWVWYLLKILPSRYLPFFIVWLVSMLTLDSLGFWGVGRACWLALSIGLTMHLKKSA